MELSVLKKAFGGLAPINEVKNAIALVTDVRKLSDLRKRIEAARKYDNQTCDRRNYWGELAIWSERQMGVLIAEANVKPGRPKGDDNNADTLSVLLGCDTDTEAQQISSRAKLLTEFEPADIEDAIASLKAEGEEVSKAAVKRKLTFPHVTNNSGENEWYTPSEYIEAARQVMGSIDLDPASSKTANKIVKAKKFYTLDDDGLSKKWIGNVWLNPPYASGLVEQFTRKLFEEWINGRTKSAVVLLNNATETQWFQSLLVECSAICFIAGRIKFLDATLEPKKTPLQGQAAVYFGKDRDGFARAFAELGCCMEGS